MNCDAKPLNRSSGKRGRPKKGTILEYQSNHKNLTELKTLVLDTLNQARSEPPDPMGAGGGAQPYFHCIVTCRSRYIVCRLIVFTLDTFDFMLYAPLFFISLLDCNQ